MRATTEKSSLAERNSVNWQNLVTVISVLILIGAEVFGVALAAGWAIAGLLELGETVSYVLMALFCLFGIYAMMILWRRAVAVEPIWR
jgi:hypothetical protein